MRIQFWTTELTMTKLRLSAAALLIVGFLACAQREAHAVAYTWTQAAGGAWTGANWGSAGHPDDAGDTATLGDIAGAYTTTLGINKTIGGLTLSGTDPTLTLNSDLTIDGGTSTISGGTINGIGALQLQNSAIVNWSSPALSGAVTIQVPNGEVVSVNNTVGSFSLGSGQILHLISNGENVVQTGTTTFSNGFSNSGEIRLGNADAGNNYGVNRLIVTNGTLTNNSAGNINMHPRTSTDSGSPWNTREIRSNVQNDGTITVFAADGILGGAGKTVTNSSTGLISIDHSTFTTTTAIPKLTITGTSFTNVGTLDVGANDGGLGGGEVLILSTTINLNSGSSVTGPGKLTLNGDTVNINAGASISGLTVLGLGGDTVNINAGASISGLTVLGFGRNNASTTVNWNIADFTDAMTFRMDPGGTITFNRTGAWNLPANQVLEFDAPPLPVAVPMSLTLSEDINNSGLVRMGREAPGNFYVNANLNLTGTKTFTNKVGGIVDMYPRTSTDPGSPWNNRYITANVVNELGGTINTYAAAGRLGDTGKTVVNNGTINVDSSLFTGTSQAQLQFIGDSFTNGSTGTIALDNSLLWLNTPTFNYDGGSITATAGSQIILGSASIDTNFIYNGGAEITGPVTYRVNPDSENTITRTSTWNILSGQSLLFDTKGSSGKTGLTVNQDVTNSGLIQMGNPPPGDNFIDHFFQVNSTNSRLINNTDGTMTMYPRSATSLGDPWSIRRVEAELTNEGQFTIFTHRGFLGKVGAGIDHVNNGTITFDDSVLAAATPQLNVTGNSMTNSASGTITGNGILDLTGIAAGLINNGTLAPGLSAGTLAVTGNLTNSATSSLAIELGGLIVGTEFDQLNISQAFVIDGELLVTLINGFENTVTNSDTFEIVTFDSATGTFSNLSDGRVTVADYDVDGLSYSFLVTIGANNIALSDFSVNPVPEPSSLMLLGLGALGLMRRSRRARRKLS